MVWLLRIEITHRFVSLLQICSTVFIKNCSLESSKARRGLFVLACLKV